MKRYILKTQGCKSNQLESVIIKEKLNDAGYEESKDIINADYFILNSCSVTSNADIEALRFLRNAKNKKPDIVTVITGCSAQLHADELKKHPYIDIILGNDDKFSIIDAINSKKNSVKDIFEINYFNNQFVHFYNNTRGYLKIQDGCNNHCSYCTIPLARGKSRSNSIDNIIKQIRLYTDIGIKEVILTGIHIGQWGQDFTEKKNFLYMLDAIENTDIVRYRLGSLYTNEIDDSLLNFLSKSEKFCPHFHLSLQSLTNKTLHAMNRQYNAENCLYLIKKIDSLFDMPFIGSDIIVGFPGESDEDFNITMNNVIKSKLSNIHVFPYSVRENTKAANMPEQIPEKIKNLRADKLKLIAKTKYSSFKKRNLNTTAQVLIEKRPDKDTGLLKGVTKNYLNVYIGSKDKSLCNTIQKVKILNTKDENLFCTII